MESSNSSSRCFHASIAFRMDSSEPSHFVSVSRAIPISAAFPDVRIERLHIHQTLKGRFGLLQFIKGRFTIDELIANRAVQQRHGLAQASPLTQLRRLLAVRNRLEVLRLPRYPPLSRNQRVARRAAAETIPRPAAIARTPARP